jgi:hypothetical protein
LERHGITLFAARRASSAGDGSVAAAKLEIVEAITTTNLNAQS